MFVAPGDNQCQDKLSTEVYIQLKFKFKHFLVFEPSLFPQFIPIEMHQTVAFVSSSGLLVLFIVVFSFCSHRCQLEAHLLVGLMNHHPLYSANEADLLRMMRRAWFLDPKPSKVLESCGQSRSPRGGTQFLRNWPVRDGHSPRRHSRRLASRPTEAISLLPATIHLCWSGRPMEYTTVEESYAIRKCNHIANNAYAVANLLRSETNLSPISQGMYFIVQ